MSIIYRIVVGIVLTIIPQWSFSQKAGDVFILFDRNNEEVCSESSFLNEEFIDHHSGGKFQKLTQKEGTIDFYICNNLFQYDGISEIEECTSDEIQAMDFKSIEEMVSIAEQKNALYPYLAFGKIYLVEFALNRYFKYEVKWLYYTE